jgi:hypothetical protein
MAETGSTMNIRRTFFTLLILILSGLAASVIFACESKGNSMNKPLVYLIPEENIGPVFVFFGQSDGLDSLPDPLGNAVIVPANGVIKLKASATALIKNNVSLMTDEQRNYVIELLSATKRVIEGTTTLETEEKNTFGEGQFFWPKDPQAPVKLLKTFLPENFRMKGIALSFSRVANGSSWTRASLSIYPINFPGEIYQINLPKETFSDYQAVKSERSIRPDESLKHVNVFQYLNKHNKRIVMTIEASEDVSSLNDIYPSSFHAIQFRKLD